MIERFWEQSLLKIALDKKTKEIGRKTSVTDGEINRAYYDMSKKGEVSEPLGQVYKRIRWELTRAKEAEMMDEWMAEMHKKTRIFVNKDILKE
jgi:hypothetical protein